MLTCLGDMAEVKRQAFKISISILCSKYIKSASDLLIFFPDQQPRDLRFAHDSFYMTRTEVIYR